MNQKFAFNLSTGADTGGAAIREVEAFRSEAGKSSGWAVRSMVASSNYIHYPQDVRYNLDTLRELWHAADVIHLNHTLHGRLWYDEGQCKPIILEHHGLHKGSFDIDFEDSITAGIEAGAVQIGSTANLELFGPPGTIKWAPIPYNLKWLQSIRALRPLHELSTITIAHAPTNRAIKSTEAFISAMAQLRAEGLPVREFLIEKESHAACLLAKAEADIFVDQLVLGYGCNAIEAWGMGMPVVGGIADPVWRKYMIARWGGMPLYQADEESLVWRLRAMVLSPDLRQEYAERGLEHFNTWHTQAKHVEIMSEIYESAQPTKRAAGPPFRGLGHKARLTILRNNRRANQVKEL